MNWTDTGNEKMSCNKTKSFLLQGLLMLLTVNAQAQQPAALTELLQMAENSYPLLKSKKLDALAAQKAVDVSKSSFMPTLDAAYQLNYSTYNNITGMSYPGQLLPISGPPSTSNQYGGVFGSATSLLLNWQPITFGRRQSQVDLAKAGAKYAGADAANEIFQHKIKVVNAYLEVLTLDELAKVYDNNLKRLESNLLNVQSLVESGIRPGVDSPLLKAEVSRAKVELLNHNNKQAQARIGLSELLVGDVKSRFADTLIFAQLPENTFDPDSLQHPLMRLYQANNEMNMARKNVLAKMMMPTLGVWGTTYARGSGISYDGTVKSTDGLGFQRFNYGVGFQLSVPLLAFARLRPQLQQQDFVINSGQQKMEGIALQLKKQQELADTTLSSALAVARESPLYLESAQFSYQAVQSRYKSGLANLSDLFQAQYALVKAETDYKLAFMGVWKALLFKAAVQGDLNLFINQVK
ncbi:TolC family protein [Dyadobacter flavalbus]|uniref:TolC family protein n=1 Tax=Dyadobacter flavalbus TaxID=2579942 RepID=A0A5M8QWH5_9BACT|nr:TolC family protein [Dyadobacter flavalbus]KAA6439688.1 TolC family protein [Dyadobacter flavalbus]